MKITELRLAKKLVEYVRPICGIYFLVDSEDRILYVGQSRNISSRLSCHRGNISFDKAYYFRAEPNDLDVLETEFIRLSEAPCNRQNRASRSPGIVGKKPSVHWSEVNYYLLPCLTDEEVCCLYGAGWLGHARHLRQEQMSKAAV